MRPSALRICFNRLDEGLMQKAERREGTRAGEETRQRKLSYIVTLMGRRLRGDGAVETIREGIICGILCVHVSVRYTIFDLQLAVIWVRSINCIFHG